MSLEPLEGETDWTTQIRHRLERITDNILTHVEETMRNGSPKAKSDLIRQVFPVLTKALAPQETNAEMEALRREIIAVMQEVGGGGGGSEHLPNP